MNSLSLIQISKNNLKTVQIFLLIGPWKGISVTKPESNQKIYIKQNSEFKQISWEELKKL